MITPSTTSPSATPPAGQPGAPDPFAPFGTMSGSVQQAPQTNVQMDGVDQNPIQPISGQSPEAPPPNIALGAPVGSGGAPSFGQAAQPGIGGGLGTSPFTMNPADPNGAPFRRIKPMQTGAGSAGMGNAETGIPDASIPQMPGRAY